MQIRGSIIREKVATSRGSLPSKNRRAEKASASQPWHEAFSRQFVFRYWNTVVLRNPRGLWKTLGWLLPGLDFIPNNFFNRQGVAKERPFLIPNTRGGERQRKRLPMPRAGSSIWVGVWRDTCDSLPAQYPSALARFICKPLLAAASGGFAFCEGEKPSSLAA